MHIVYVRGCAIPPYRVSSYQHRQLYLEQPTRKDKFINKLL